MLEEMGYPGGKSGPGVYHRLINLMPPHQTYIEPFLGGGAIMRLKRPAVYNIGVDMDAEVIRDWRSHIGVPGCSGSQADPAGHIGNSACGSGIGARTEAADLELKTANRPIPDRSGGNGDGRSRNNLVGSVDPPTSAALGGSAVGARADPRKPRAGIGAPTDPCRRRSANPPLGDLELKAANPPIRDRQFRFLRGDALTFLASYPFAPDDLIYCDPPYLMETRSSGRLYRHEFSEEQHAELLSTIVELPCRVMISGYWSELYACRLHRWNSIHFEAMTRGGMATEWLWFNYAPPVALHDYRYLGETAHQRQDLKRMVASWTGKLGRMPPLKKQALLAAIARIG